MLKIHICYHRNELHFKIDVIFISNMLVFFFANKFWFYEQKRPGSYIDIKIGRKLRSLVPFFGLLFNRGQLKATDGVCAYVLGQVLPMRRWCKSLRDTGTDWNRMHSDRR